MLVMALLACQQDTYLNTTTTDVTDVQGAGDVEISATELVWTDLNIGEVTGQTLYIHSIGELNLVLYEARLISTGNGAFYIEETEDKVIAPGVSYELLVVANVDNDNVRQGTLRLKTNDIDALEMLIELTASTGIDDADDTGTDTGEQ